MASTIATSCERPSRVSQSDLLHTAEVQAAQSPGGAKLSVEDGPEVLQHVGQASPRADGEGHQT